MGKKDIKQVLRDHEQELMSVAGVVGVCLGLLPDGKSQCLKIMVTKINEDIQQKIPTAIEGYPVLVQESGIISPF